MRVKYVRRIGVFIYMAAFTLFAVNGVAQQSSQAIMKISATVAPVASVIPPQQAVVSLNTGTPLLSDRDVNIGYLKLQEAQYTETIVAFPRELLLRVDEKNQRTISIDFYKDRKGEVTTYELKLKRADDILSTGKYKGDYNIQIAYN